MDRKGFTLIEVLIVIFIFGMLQIVLITELRHQMNNQKRAQDELDFFNRIRFSINIMERDVENIFNPIVFKPSRAQTVDINALNSSNPEVFGTDYWTRLLDPVGVRGSRFYGQAHSMSFISASHERIYHASRESVFSKILLEIKDKTLYRTENTNAFNTRSDDFSGTKTYKILDGIEEMTFRYFHRRRQKWFDEWDSGTEELRDEMPDIISITITCKGGDSHLSYTGEYWIRREHPLGVVEAKI